MTNYKRGITVVTFNRAFQLAEIIEAVLSTKPNNAAVSIADDGSTDNTLEIITANFKDKVNYYGGANGGNSVNKNRALFAMKDKDFCAIIEDDIKPIKEGWFEQYEKACLGLDIHHFCRVQGHEIPETSSDFNEYCFNKLNLNPIYSFKPRGDVTFLSKKTMKTVGAFSPRYRGCGHSHGNWSDRCVAAGLIGHPNKFIDFVETRDSFVQLGDQVGGRWNEDPEKIKAEIESNSKIRKELGVGQICIPVFLP